MTNTSAPGISGWNGHHLNILLENQDCINGIQSITKLIVNGEITGDLHRRLTDCRLIGISKDDGKDGIRPIAIMETFYKLAEHYVMQLIELHLPDIFPDIQYAFVPGAAEVAAHHIKAAWNIQSQLHTDAIILKIDISNAFNSASRAQMMKRLMEDERTKPLWRLFYWSYATPSDLHIYDGRKLFSTLPSKQGTKQGGPMSAFGFALGIHPVYRQVAQHYPQVTATADHDDFTLVGSAAQVLPAFNLFQKLVWKECKLTINATKSEYMPAINPTPAQQAFIEKRAADLHLPPAVNNAMEVLGVCISQSKEQVIAHCNKKVQDSALFFDRLCHRDMKAQCATLLQRVCGIPRFNYMCRTTHPELLLQAAADFDEMQINTFQQIMHIEKETMESAEIAQQQMRLPLSQGGFGLRSTAQVSTLAYFSSLIQCLPYIIRSFPDFDHSKTEVHADMLYCISQLKLQGLDFAKLNLQDDVQQIWEKARRDGLSRNKSTEKLQREMTYALEQTDLKRLLASASPATRNRIDALARPNTSRWLTALPTDTRLQMKDGDFRQAIRHRLGLSPLDSPLPAYCSCDASLDADPAHAHVCKENRREITRRHDDIKHVITALAREAEATVEEEPTSLRMPAGTDPDSHIRPDILIRTLYQQVLVDVTVVHSASDSYASASPSADNGTTTVTAASHSITSLLPAATVVAALRHLPEQKPDHPALMNRQQHKHRLYDELAAENRSKLCAVVLESHGAVNQEGIQFMKLLARQMSVATGLNRKEAKTLILDCMSFALQRGNGQMNVEMARQAVSADARSLRHRSNSAPSTEAAQNDADHNAAPIVTLDFTSLCPTYPPRPRSNWQRPPGQMSA